MADNTTTIVFTAQDRASQVMRQLVGNVDRMQSTFGGLSSTLLRFQSVWASLVGGALVAGLNSMIGAIDDLDEKAQGLGLTAVELSNLRQAAGEAGVGAETFDSALTRLNVNLSNAAAGSKEQAALFKALGVSIRDAGGNVRPTSEVLRDVADRFSKLEDGPAKAALAVDLFGRAGAKLIPLLNQGASGMSRFSGLTEETVKAATDLQREIDRLDANFERIKNTILSGVVPALNQLIDVSKNASLGGAGENGQSMDADLLRAMGGAVGNSEAYDALLARQRQVREALALGAGAYSNEGRQAQQSAQAVRDKAAADAAAAAAAGKKAKATNDASSAYAKEFADLARIRSNRQREFERDEEERQRERERRAQRLRDLTGESGAAQQLEDLRLLDEAFFEGGMSAEKYDRGLQKIFGSGSDIEKGMERQTELADQLGLTMASSLGDLITAGGRAGDVWKALGQDIAKLITQMLIIKPLAEELKKIFNEVGKGAGGGGGGSSWLSMAGSLVSSFFGGGGGGANADGSWGVSGHNWFGGSGAAGAGAANITINIDGAVDRARVATYVETGVRAGIAASRDNLARGGSGVLS